MSRGTRAAVAATLAILTLVFTIGTDVVGALITATVWLILGAWVASGYRSLRDRARRARP